MHKRGQTPKRTWRPERDCPCRGDVDDRLTADELGDRFEAAHEARTLDELQRLIPSDD
jgi:hypothetical protein